jgi:PKD repeat protein
MTWKYTLPSAVKDDKIDDNRCMSKYSLLFCGLILSFCEVSGQLSVPGIPESFSIRTKKVVDIPVKLLQPIDTSKYLIEDKKRGIPNRYAVVEQMETDIKTAGAKTTIEGKGYIWQYKLTSAQSLSIGISFGKYLLPEGASVFIYNEEHTQIIGAFTERNNNPDQQLTIADFKGENAIIEYFEPLNPVFPGQLSISSVLQAYKSLLNTTTTRVGINCPEGSADQDAKHAVCRMTFHDAYYGYYCTGFLVNNVRKDGTPYFQTANHCISTSTEAATLVTYFNYENSTCSGSDASLTQTLSGSVLKATSSYSDFTLLLLNEYPPASYQAYYAGWDASSRAPQNGTCIHHPAGTPKCIALDYNPPVSYAKSMQWTDDNNVVISTTVPNSHWEIQNDVGATEGGSSGSPLFDDNLHVIGQLHGGSDLYDFHGKFSLSWNHNSSASAQLQTWLDPDNTGTLKLDGIYSNMKPKAAFSAALTQICQGSTIKLTNNSQYNPVSWKWNIFPSTFKFQNGTSANSQNPLVTFDSIGNYTISLAVANTNGTDSTTKTNYINVGDIVVKLSKIASDSIVCGCNFIKYPLGASGASSYVFSTERPDKMTYTVSSDSIFLSLRSEEKKNGSFNSWIRVTGTQGNCVSTDSLQLIISMPTNDDVENAIRLEPGRNKTFSNKCASVETNEPVASFSTLKNTIWFTFRAPSNGLISIDTHGFNDRIAVYDAGTSSDLLSGTRSSYKMIASNDDRSSLDKTSLISNLTVDPYKQYWLQIDGSDGSTGECTIDLLSNSMEVFPNPSNGEFNVIISNAEDGNAEVKIASLTGQILYTYNLPVTKENNRFAFNLSSYPAGLYVILAKINGSTMQTKIMLVK